jgi:hypothetical protein
MAHVSWKIMKKNVDLQGKPVILSEFYRTCIIEEIALNFPGLYKFFLVLKIYCDYLLI